MYIKEIILNGLSIYFGLSFFTNKCLLDDFIISSPWYNVPEECSIKGNILH